MVSRIIYLALLGVLVFGFGFSQNVYADIQNLSGSSHGNEILLEFSDETASGTITLEDHIINLSDTRVIERGDRLLIIDKQNDLKILSKPLSSNKYLVIAKINSEDVQTKLRLIATAESTQNITGQRNLLEEMKMQSEEPQQSPDSLTHRELQDLLKQQEIEDILKQQAEIRLTNENQGELGQSIIDSYNAALSSATGPGLLLKVPNMIKEKEEVTLPPVTTFDIEAFLSVPHNGEWKQDMIYDVLVTDTSGHRYDPQYKSFTGNVLKDVKISGTVNDPSGKVLDEFEGITAINGKYQNTFYVEENINTVGEYSISITATKYFADGKLTKAEASDTFFVFPTDGGSASNNPPIADAGPDQSKPEHDGVIPTFTEITLDGTGSSDPDGDTITYLWTQTSGTIVPLSDATAQQPTFTAPNITITEDLIFNLTVTDVKGLTNTDSVTIKITFVN